MARITVKDLNNLCDRLNRITNNPLDFRSVGSYHVNQEFGGYNLYQTVNDLGGERNVFSQGAVPAKELYSLMQAFIAGYMACQQDYVNANEV